MVRRVFVLCCCKNSISDDNLLMFRGYVTLGGIWYEELNTGISAISPARQDHEKLNQLIQIQNISQVGRYSSHLRSILHIFELEGILHILEVRIILYFFERLQGTRIILLKMLICYPWINKYEISLKRYKLIYYNSITYSTFFYSFIKNFFLFYIF